MIKVWKQWLEFQKYNYNTCLGTFWGTKEFHNSPKWYWQCLEDFSQNILFGHMRKSFIVKTIEQTFVGFKPTLVC